MQGRPGPAVPHPHRRASDYNESEAAIRGFKLAEKVSDCWRTPATLQPHCRIRSHLVSARNHGHRPPDVIRGALTGTAWTPARTTAHAPAA